MEEQQLSLVLACLTDVELDAAASSAAFSATVAAEQGQKQLMARHLVDLQQVSVERARRLDERTQ
jgi:hypothetical protein